MSPSKFDWAEIRRRLEHSAVLSGSRDAQTRRQILRERARALAQLPADEAPQVEELEVLEFVLAREHYALELPVIREVSVLRHLVRLPGTPPFLCGIVNARGRIVSVIDLRRFFDLPGQGLTDLNRVIVIADEQMEIGLLADVILGVRRITSDAVQPPPPTFTGIRREYLRGVTHEQLAVLDATRLLQDRRLIIGAEDDQTKPGPGG